jgi:pectin methylesterase-like acyl-CoA thioesterase
LMNLDANLPGNATANGATAAGRNFTDTVNPSGAIFTTDKTTTFSGIWKMYYTNASKTSNIGTGSSCVVWVKNAGFQIKNMTIENSYNENFTSSTYYSVNKQLPEGNHQAVALEADGVNGKQHYDKIRLISNQDTLYIKASAVFTTIRTYFSNCYVEGDVDFIFGRATAYFYKCEIKALGSRGVTNAYCTASSANYNTTYGYVFDDCDFTSDGIGIAAASTASVNLGRQWFESISTSPYNAATVILGTNSSTTDTRDATHCPRYVYEAVGKVIIKNSRIGNHITKTQPWADWATSGTAYRLVQYTSDDYWSNLSTVLTTNAAVNGTTTMTTLYSTGKKSPAETFLAEYNNVNN